MDINFWRGRSPQTYSRGLPFAVSSPHVATERGPTHPGVAPRPAEGLRWLTEGRRIRFVVVMPGKSTYSPGISTDPGGAWGARCLGLDRRGSRVGLGVVVVGLACAGTAAPPSSPGAAHSGIPEGRALSAAEYAGLAAPPPTSIIMCDGAPSIY